MRPQAKMSDVAAMAGVSLGTVSNYFNRPEKVSAVRRKRIADVVQTLGFVPNGLARAFVQGRQSAVGLLVLDLENPFFSVAARAMEDRLAEVGMLLTVSSSDEDPERERRYLQLIEQHAVAGLVVTSSTETLHHLSELRGRGLPIVLLARRVSDTSWCTVSGDDERGGAMVADHLCALGHRQIAYVNGSGGTRLRDARHEGVSSRVRAAGRHFVEVFAPVMTLAGGESAADQLLSMTPRPTAIACANDLLALGVMRRLAAAGVSVPEEMSVVGYDDAETLEGLAVPLSTVRQDKYALGRQAVDLLLSEINEPEHQHRQVVLAPELILRASTSAPTG